MPNLYVVATPIGNLEDISLRALRILRGVKLIAAEDTRKTRYLLKTYDVKTPVTSYHEQNKWTRMGYILKQLDLGDVALVSEAGTPGISDPGYELITAAIRKEIPIIAIPGASSIITAMVISGMPTDRFVYVGFLPRKPGDRKRLLESVAREPGTIIANEAPHRLKGALDDIFLVLGDRNITICRELTKLHEEVFRSTVFRAQEHFNQPRGEFTLVIEGHRERSKPKLTPDIERQLEAMHTSGQKAKEAVARVARETGVSRKELYRAWIRM
jgi:16S rRNA (cytidine1402-2'-O)-methyltransferase